MYHGQKGLSKPGGPAQVSVSRGGHKYGKKVPERSLSVSKRPKGEADGCPLAPAVSAQLACSRAMVSEWTSGASHGHRLALVAVAVAGGGPCRCPGPDSRGRHRTGPPFKALPWLLRVEQVLFGNWETVEEDTIRCSQCRSTHIARKSRKGRMKKFYAAQGILQGVLVYRYYCRNSAGRAHPASLRSSGFMTSWNTIGLIWSTPLGVR